MVGVSLKKGRSKREKGAERNDMLWGKGEKPAWKKKLVDFS